MRSFYLLSVILITQVLASCIHKGVRRTAEITYAPAVSQKLDVYSKKDKSATLQPVLIFVHGGNWRSGDKSLYKFLGKGFAQKGIVTVVINYRLSDKQDYAGMAHEVAQSVKWVKENISQYGGDDKKIFLSGHSSGGHLAALVALDERYLTEAGVMGGVKGVLLIDPFGLDIHHYLSTSTSIKDTLYFRPFSGNEKVWEKASPIKYITEKSPPFLMLVGEKTFPAIKHDSKLFQMALVKYYPEATLHMVKRKKHIPMIFMFGNGRNKNYDLVKDFIKSH
jgi:acetyl esterase/lipase